MIKKFVVSAIVLSLMMVVGVSQAGAQADNASDKAQVASCMQNATAKKNAAFESVQDTFLAAIKNAKEKGENTWWPWSKARAEARKIKREAKRIAKEAFAEDREACKESFKTDNDKDDNEDEGDKDDNDDKDKGDNGDREDKEISVNISAQNNSGISGKAELEEENGNVKVEIELTGSPTGSSQPAHIHIGACPNPGAVSYPLSNVVNGKSETILTGTTIAKLKGELPLAINVHKSQDEVAVYVACGDVKF